jgi:hypothetical protein
MSIDEGDAVSVTVGCGSIGKYVVATGATGLDVKGVEEFESVTVTDNTSHVCAVTMGAIVHVDVVAMQSDVEEITPDGSTQL